MTKNISVNIAVIIKRLLLNRNNRKKTLNRGVVELGQ